MNNTLGPMRRFYALNAMSEAMKEICHPVYTHRIEDWMKIRDCYDGQRAVKEKMDVYLPALGGQSQEDYLNYLNRALFFPITGKTAQTLVGYALLKAPKLEYPKMMEPYFIDSEKPNQFVEFYTKMLLENILQGRLGVLVDAPASGSTLPELVTYRTENLLNWWTFEDGTLQAVLLREWVFVKDDKKPFKQDKVCRFRYPFIDSDGVYKVRLYDDELMKNFTETIPTFAGRTLDYLPFTIIGATGVHVDVDTPPMLDISTINISHYMSSADLEWGRHFTGLPTPVVSGVDAGTKLSIGGTSAWILPDKDSRATYLEFLGQGLKSLENALQEKVGLMATMSARLVDASSKGSEAESTVRMRYLSETASLSQIITSTESALNVIYNMVAKMLNDSPVKISLSRDFLNTMVSAPVLKVLFEAYFQGALPKDALVYNLRKSEYLDPNSTDEQAMAAIADYQDLANNANAKATLVRTQQI